MRPNCSGVNEKLKMRLRINGRATVNRIFFFQAMYKTLPNESAIMIYNTVQTGPKTQLGGAHEGFKSVEYHEYASLMLYSITDFCDKLCSNPTSG